MNFLKRLMMDIKWILNGCQRGGDKIKWIKEFDLRKKEDYQELSKYIPDEDVYLGRDE